MDKLIRKFKKREIPEAENSKVDRQMAFQKIIKIAFKKRIAVELEVNRRL